jgi:hypothetical protein
VGHSAEAAAANSSAGIAATQGIDCGGWAREDAGSASATHTYFITRTQRWYTDGR